MDNNGVNNNIQGRMPGPGMPQQGMPQQGMPMNGAPMTGQMPGQGMLQQGRMPMNGAPMPGRMPGQGMPQQGMPMNGAPIQGPGIPPQRMPEPGNIPGQRMSQQGTPGQGISPQGRMPMNGAPMQGRMQGLGIPPQGRMPMNGVPMQGGTRNREIPSQRTPMQETSAQKKLFEDKDRKKESELNSVSGGIVAGIAGFNPYIYGGILVLCLTIALIVYGSSHKGGTGKKYSIPTDMITYTGIFRNIYEKAASGSLGSSTASSGVLYDDDGTEIPAAPTALGEAPGSGTDSSAVADTASSGDGTTSGATMELDSGAGTSGYSQAESYNELLTQVESAIASGDTDFIGRKFAYEDEDGNLKGYPQSVVDHFVTYMSTNSDKRDSLMMELSNDKYQGQNEDAFIVKLPYIKFVVNMGYDDTTISLPGFSDQVVNAGQSADIAPLLPCMYTLTISNPEWSEPVTRDIEANVNEATISINIKP